MSESNQFRRAIYPGTFDPVTKGHLSLIDRGSRLFDEVVVAIAESDSKRPLFELDERLAMMQHAVSELPSAPRIKIKPFTGLLADFAYNEEASVIIRGLRAVSDFEYEFQMALMNRKLQHDIETVFLMPSLSWVYLSSSIVKDVAANHGDVSDLVPAEVNAALKRKFKS